MLSRLKDLTVYGLRSLVWLLRSLFGAVRWAPPPWLAWIFAGVATGVARLRRGLNSARLEQPKAFYGTILGLALVIGGSVAGWRYYESLPKPERFSVNVNTPGITPLQDNAVIESAVVTFGGSAAPLEAVGKPVTQGVTMQPALKGAWKWDTDQSLSFTPGEDWAVDQEYVVTLDKSLFPKHVLLETYELKFKTAPFSLRIASGEFYTDPKDPKIKRVLATVKATHPLDGDSLKKHLTLKKKVKKKGEFKLTDDLVPFSVTFDKFLGEAYVVSDNVPVPLEEQYVVVTVDSGVKSTRGGNETEKELTSDVRVPGMYDYFRISEAKASIVRNEKYEPEQVLVVETTAPALQADIQKALTVWELPKDRPESPARPAQKNYGWYDAGEVGADILKLSRKIELTPIPTEKEYDTLHSFRYKGDVGRYLFVRIEKGIKSYGDYVLAKTFEVTTPIPELPKEVSIMHSGSILSLTGDQRLSVVARDVPAIKFDVGRVLPTEINHLITQTGGTFQQPYFNNYSFKEDNISEKFAEVRPLAEVEKGKAQYTSFDFAKYSSEGGGQRRGLFFLKATGWDAEHDSSLGVEDRRFILITDLGLVVKTALDGAQDVFVVSIRTGRPVQGAKVEVLGKNGLTVVTQTTDGEGHASIPTLKDFTAEKQPTVYLVTKDKDLSFLPFDRSDRLLNLSRFDVGGEASQASEGALMAYLFSDRGIYRPGDTFHIGMIVKDAQWKRDLSGVPLEAVVTDPRGLVVNRERISLNAEGFEETQYTTRDTSPTGDYQVSLYVVRNDGKEKDWLGSATVRVEEFLPDRLRITTRFSVLRNEGWVQPKDLKALVSLQNLFGTPAADRRVTGGVRLVPWYPGFRSYPEFVFFDPRKAKSSFSESVKEQKTDDKGEASFDLELNRFEDATYRLTFVAEGFEAEGGRGVSSQVSTLVSPNPYLVGFKPDGDLHYVKRGGSRGVELIAVDPELKQLAVPDLKAHLVELRYVSVLTKQASGVYKYESVRKEVTVDTQKLELGAKGTKLALKTDKAGDYALIIQDGTDRELNRIEYSVAGQANLTRSLERNAELQLKLAKNDYAPGESVELEIVAPYTGTGLITIEKDRVYAYKWFTASTTGSVQKIDVPADLEGNGYVSVSFVRDIGSQEIFMSPLSYGVAPFSVSRERRVNDIQLVTADLARPGEPFPIKFKTKKPGKIAIIAVDEGILQVARYQTPDPLAAFFKKKALEVRTAQILDLILPEFELVRALSAPGGDADGALAANLNPFKRRRQKPVAYWSGIIDSGPDERQVVYDVPDYFNGTLRVMAVAVAPDAIGVKKNQAIVRGPFVINPNVPTFVAPGDEFQVSVSVANMIEGSGDKAKVKLQLETGAGTKVLDEPVRELEIAAGKEVSAVFKLRATDDLGSANLKFTASLGDKRSQSETELSVRPPNPYFTRVQAGAFKDETLDVPVTRAMYPAYRTLEASGSAVPLGLAKGLINYLEKFPYGCTEQIVSKTFPVLVLRTRPDFKYDPKAAQDIIDNTLSVLRSRQNGEGAFGFWASNSYVSDFQVAYATHFLTEAKERGVPVPPDLLQHAFGYLLEVLKTQPTTLAEAREHAYALYVVTRGGIVTTNQLDALVSQIQEKLADSWQTDLTGIYVAATYKLLKQESDAAKLIGKQEFGTPQKADYDHFYDGLVRDSQLLYILAKHFPDRLQKLDAKDLDAIVKPIAAGSFNTVSSSFAVLALDAYADQAAKDGLKSLTIAEVLDGDKTKPLPLTGEIVKSTVYTDAAKKLRFKTEGGGALFYQVTEAGFDKALPKDAIKDKLEVQREYRDEKGSVVTSAKLGDKLEVHLKVRAISGARYDHVAVVDLLPAGFEVEMQKAPVEAAASPADNSNQGAAAPTPDAAAGAEGEDGGGGGEGAVEPAADDGNADGSGSDSGAPAGAGRIEAGGSSWAPDYVDIREDRVVLFGSITDKVSEFVYKIRSTNQGTFQVPPIYAESMYDRSVQALSLGGRMTVEAP